MVYCRRMGGRGEHRLVPVTELADAAAPRYCLHLFKGYEFLEILLTERINHEVIFRKNNKIRMDIKEFTNGNPTRPFVNPAWQLLFKSLDTRPEDDHDFKVYLRRVNDNKSKNWLLQNMIIADGNKSWIDALQKDLLRSGD